MYEDMIKELKDSSRRDAEHAASYFAIEHMSKAALILMVFWFFKIFSPIAALLTIPWTALYLHKRSVTSSVLKENDSRIQTLLFYMIVTLGIVLAFVGWHL